jgi:hypothetical protein
VPAVDDILKFNDPASPLVTNVKVETIGQLFITNNTTVELQMGAAGALTIGGGSNEDFTIAAGSALTLSAPTNALTLAFGTGSSGTISGTLNIGTNCTFNATNANGSGTCKVEASGKIFNGGTVTATTNLTLVANASYNHTRDGGAVPALTYMADSKVNITGVVTATALTFPGSLSADVDWNCPSQTVTTSLTGMSSVPGDFTVISTGGAPSVGSIFIPNSVQFNGNLNQIDGKILLNNGPSASTLTLRKDLNQTGGIMTIGGVGMPTLVFDGGALEQKVIFNGSVVGKISYTMQNSGGIKLTGTMSIEEGAKLTIKSAAAPFSGSGLVVYAAANSTLEYAGSQAQTANDFEFPAVNGPTILLINNTFTYPNNTVSLSGLTGNRTVTGQLGFSNGFLKLDDKFLTLDKACTFFGHSSTAGSAKLVVQNSTGRLKRVVKVVNPGDASFICSFPIGLNDGTSAGVKYLACQHEFITNDRERTITAAVFTGQVNHWNYPGIPTDYINRWWHFEDSEFGNGHYSYKSTFRYVPEDKETILANTQDANLKVNRWGVGSTSWSQIASEVTFNPNALLSSTAVPNETEASSPIGGSDFTARVNPTSDFTWTGAVDRDWFKAANWTPNTSIPSGSDNVIINTAPANQPKISQAGGPVAIKDLALTTGSLELEAGASLTVDGVFNYNPSATAIFPCGSTFTYGNPNQQEIFDFTYGNLASTGTANRILADGNINICGTFTIGTGQNVSYAVGTNGSVNFFGTEATSIPAINYYDLNISGNRGANNVTLASGTINIGNNFTVSATFNPTAPAVPGAFVPGTSTVVLSNPNPITIPAINYYNLTATGGDRTIDGTIKIGGTFLPGTTPGTYTVNAGSTVEFYGSQSSTIPVIPVAAAVAPAISYNYHNLVVSGTQTYTFGGNINIAGDFTQKAGIVNVSSNGAMVNNTINIAGDIKLSGRASFRLIGSTSSTGATVKVNNVNIAGKGGINMKSAAGSGVGTITVAGNLISSSDTLYALDFGTAVLAGSEVRIAGDLKINGTGTIAMQGSGSAITYIPTGITFNGTGVQTFTCIPTYLRVPLNLPVGKKLKLGSDIKFAGVVISARRTLITIDGDLDMGGFKFASDGTNNVAFIVNANGSVKTEYATGFTGATAYGVTGAKFAAYAFDPAADLEFSGSTAITNGAFPTTVDNLTVNNSITVTLGSNITVGGILTMTNGILQTGINKVILGSTATISAEGSSNYVKGNVETSKDMSLAGTYNFNEIGLKLSAQAGAGVSLPGSTKVTRITGSVVTAPNGNRSITRQFRIEPTINQDLNVDIEFAYLDHELETSPGMFIDENNLVFFKSADGNAPWAPRNFTSRDVNANTVTLTGQKDFSTWTLGDINAPLPVEMVAFNAKKVGSDVELAWTTATEVNSQGYEVQVSTNGNEFYKLGFVESHNGNTLQTYRFTDVEEGKSGIRYYRLKQTDMDGTVSYYGPKTVRFEAKKLQLTAYPNPFEREVNLEILAAETGKATLKFSDLTGKTILVQEVSLLKGNNKLLIGLDEHLPAGVYLLQAQFGAEQIITRLLKR